MENVKEKVTRVLKKLQKYFSEIANVYVEDRNGNYGLVENYKLKVLNEEIRDLKDELKDLKKELGEENYEALIGVIDDIDYEKMPMEQISQLIQTAKLLIAKNATIKIDEYKSTPRGGDIAEVIQIEKDEERTRGGIIVPRKKSESEEQLVGEYTKTDDSYKILNEFAKRLGELANTNTPVDKADAKRAVYAIMKNNRDAISKTLKDSSKSLHELQAVKKVKKKNIHLGAYRAVIVGLAAGMLAASFSGKGGTTVAIQSAEIENYNISNEINSEINDTIDMIANNYISENGKLQEEQILGKIEPGVEVEVEARESRISSMERVDKIQQDMEKLENQYAEISQPTNTEWIKHQIEKFNQYDKVLGLHSNIADAGIDNMEKWNEYNQEHVNKNQDFFSEKTKEAHKAEVDYNNDEIKEYQETKSDIESQKTQNADRTNFYKAFSEMKNIDDIKNIEFTTEKIYNFSKSDIGQKLGEEKLFEMLEGKNLDLFANFANQNIKVDNLEEFVETYAKVEHSYNTYIREYCNGNIEQADESKYIQFIEGIMNKGELDKVGKRNVFKRIGGILQIDKLNQTYYNDYGKEDITEAEKGVIGKLKGFIRKTIDTAKISDYNKMVDDIKKIRELDNSKENNDKGDSGYGEINN